MDSDYTTLSLIEDIKKVLKKYPEELLKIFPNRIKRYHGTDLCELWGKSQWYIKGLRRQLRNDSNFKISYNSLDDLEKNLISELGVKATGSIRLISDYNKNNIGLNTFLNALLLTVSKVFEIKVTLRELNDLLGYGDSSSLSKTIRRIEGKEKGRYTLDFKFNLERLDLLKDNMQNVLGLKAASVLEIIKRYKKSNPDLKEYSYQQYTIINPMYFRNMNTPEQFYWFGLLVADGSLPVLKNKKTYNIYIRLSWNDKPTLEKFADVVGLPKDRILKVLQFREDNEGILIPFEYAQINFGCKPMRAHLEALELLKFKRNQIGLPFIIKQLINKAKQDSLYWGETNEGKQAFSFLLGFYDGDGNYRGGRSTRITNSNKKFIQEVKEFYGSPNIITVDSRGTFTLHLGVELFMAILLSFENSMARKRPRNQYSPHNYSKEKLRFFYANTNQFL